MRWRGIAAWLAAAGLLVVLPTASAVAQSVTWETIGTGLDSPRGVFVERNGAIYVAEAGAAGEECIGEPEEQYCFGPTGAVTKIHQGTQRRVLEGLPSWITPEGGPLGPSDVHVRGNHELLVTIGLGADPAIREELPEWAHTFGWLIEANQRTGAWRPVADISGFEAAANPDGNLIDTNPNAVFGFREGTVVADAGANALVQTRGGSGDVSVVAVFPDTMAPAPPFLGLPPGTEIPMQAVPDSVTRGPDGAWYVGLLTGFPFEPGAATVMRVVPGSAPTLYAGGFTNVMDIAFAPDGTLYVLEIAHNGLLSGDPTGGLWRVPAGGGEAELLLTEPLFMPGGLAVAPDGSLVISNCSVCPGEGSVLRVWPG